MRQLDQRRGERRGDGWPPQQTGRRCGADLMERRAQFERLLAAESRLHGRQWILLLLRELMRPRWTAAPRCVAIHEPRAPQFCEALGHPSCASCHGAIAEEHI